MVTSRTLSAKRPVFPYRSKGYSILYYGVSRKSPFKTSEIKQCLSGLFPSKTRTYDFAQHAINLNKAGLLDRIDQETWVVTPEGIRAMIEAAAYQREFRIRSTSIRYISEAGDRIREIHASRLGLMEKLDAEDKILEEIHETIVRRNGVKKASRR